MKELVEILLGIAAFVYLVWLYVKFLEVGTYAVIRLTHLGRDGSSGEIGQLGRTNNLGLKSAK